jgi:hypothetical protein
MPKTCEFIVGFFEGVVKLTIQQLYKPWELRDDEEDRIDDQNQSSEGANRERVIWL